MSTNNKGFGRELFDLECHYGVLSGNKKEKKRKLMPHFRFGHSWIPHHMYALDSKLYNGLENETDDFLASSDTRLGLFMTSILNESAPQTDRYLNI